MSTMPLYDLADTWNAAGTAFNAIKMNVTDTASDLESYLIDLRVGGASKFSVRKEGNTLVGGILTVTNSARFQGSRTSIGWSVNGIVVGNDSIIGFNTLSTAGTAAPTIALAPDAADTLAQRRGTNAQTFRVYGTYTDASNLRRLAISMNTSGVAEIKPEGLGTGASGNVLHISGLPTANPGPGILWNNGGTVEVGT